jgi:hypothetical protein
VVVRRLPAVVATEVKAKPSGSARTTQPLLGPPLLASTLQYEIHYMVIFRSVFCLQPRGEVNQMNLDLADDRLLLEGPCAISYAIADRVVADFSCRFLLLNSRSQRRVDGARLSLVVVFGINEPVLNVGPESSLDKTGFVSRRLPSGL